MEVIRHIFLCKTDDVPVGGALKVSVDGRPPFAVFNLSGKYYVIDDTCSHAQASLSEGDIEDDLVICPVHWAAFHIPTGENRAFPATCPVNAYKALIEGGNISIEIKN